MPKNQIVLTEQDLHKLVEDAVKTLIINEGLEEGWWGGVKNAWNGAKQGNFNLATSYRTGNWASSFNSYGQEAINALQQMKDIAIKSNNKPIATSINQIIKQIQQAGANFTKMAQNAAAPQQVDTTVKNPWAKKTAPRKTNAPVATGAATTTGGVPSVGTAVPGGAATGTGAATGRRIATV